MNSFAKKLFSSFSLLSLVLLAFGVSNLTAEAAAPATVQNVSGVPYNSGAVISWNAVPGATSYEVFSGLYSVSEGLATSYDESVNSPGTETSFALPNLTNGVKYYVAVKAKTQNEQSADFSSEITVTPSSVYDALPTVSTATPPANVTTENDAPTVESALALTTNLVKVEFSKDIELPEILPELSFSVSQSDDPAVSIAVEKVVYKIDYEGESNEQVHKNIVFVTLQENTMVDTEYTITASAAVTDALGNPIESGVTDFAIFTGTDATEIPAAEKPLTGNSAPGTNPTPEDAAAVADTIAPEDASNFAITSTPGEGSFWLDLNWKKSSAPDLADQKLYESTAQGPFAGGTSLGKDTETYRTTGAPETELTYKITSVDTSGNESAGVIASIRLPKLAATGAPFALLALGGSFIASSLRKFRNKK